MEMTGLFLLNKGMLYGSELLMAIKSIFDSDKIWFEGMPTVVLMKKGKIGLKQKSCFNPIFVLSLC